MQYPVFVEDIIKVIGLAGNKQEGNEEGGKAAGISETGKEVYQFKAQWVKGLYRWDVYRKKNGKAQGQQ